MSPARPSAYTPACSAKWGPSRKGAGGRELVGQAGSGSLPHQRRKDAPQGRGPGAGQPARARPHQEISASSKWRPMQGDHAASGVMGTQCCGGHPPRPHPSPSPTPSPRPAEQNQCPLLTEEPQAQASHRRHRCGVGMLAHPWLCHRRLPRHPGTPGVQWQVQGLPCFACPQGCIGRGLAGCRECKEEGGPRPLLCGALCEHLGQVRCPLGVSLGVPELRRELTALRPLQGPGVFLWMATCLPKDSKTTLPSPHVHSPAGWSISHSTWAVGGWFPERWPS